MMNARSDSSREGVPRGAGLRADPDRGRQDRPGQRRARRDLRSDLGRRRHGSLRRHHPRGGGHHRRARQARGGPDPGGRGDHSDAHLPYRPPVSDAHFPVPTGGTRGVPHPSASRIAIVLAAGRSVRLREVTGGGSKALVRLGGVPLGEGAVRSLWAAGITDVVVVVGYNAGPVAAVVSRLARAGPVRAVMAESWELGNGASLRAARTVAEGQESFVLMTADHVFSEGALTGLMSAPAPAVLVDRHPDPETWEEGTRVREREGSVVAMGKELDEPAVECGAFVLPTEVFDHQEKAAAAGDHSLAGAVSGLAAVRPFRIVPLPEEC